MDSAAVVRAQRWQLTKQRALKLLQRECSIARGKKPKKSEPVENVDEPRSLSTFLQHCSLPIVLQHALRELRDEP